MKTMLLLILLLAVCGTWAFGVGVAFLIGGAVTKIFNTTDGGLLLFIGLAIAWSVWFAANAWRAAVGAVKG
jgi:hypothetical protein